MKPILKDTSMQLHRTSESGLFNPRVLLAFVLCSVGIVLGMFSVAARPSAEAKPWNRPVPPTSVRSSQMAVRSALEAGALPPEMRLLSGVMGSRPDPLGTQFFGNRQV